MTEMVIRSVLVTGSNRGIGLELVKKFLSRAQPPEQIFATCRDPDGPRGEELKNLASKYANLVLVQLDATNPVSIKQAVTQVETHLKESGLNLLINNAGVMTRVDLETVDAEDMLDVYKTNVVGPTLVTQAFYPLLKKSAANHAQESLSSRKAAVVNMSSILGSMDSMSVTYDPLKQVVSYRMSKAALNMLTRCQSEGYRKDGILCVALHPGWVKTDMGTDRALLTTDESVTGIMKVLNALSKKQNGILLGYDGKVIPW